jgi:hypothetical protein
VSTDDPGVAAAVRKQLQGWSPEGDESGLNDYRTSIREYLDGKLNCGPGVDQHVVASHRSGSAPDVVVGDRVGILVEPVVSEGGQGRLRTRLDRFDGEYALVLTVAVEVRDETAWQELQDEYATGHEAAGTVYGFVVANLRRESGGTTSHRLHPREVEPSKLRQWLRWVVLGLFFVPLTYGVTLLRFGNNNGIPGGGFVPYVTIGTELLGFLAVFVVGSLLWVVWQDGHSS